VLPDTANTSAAISRPVRMLFSLLCMKRCVRPGIASTRDVVSDAGHRSHPFGGVLEPTVDLPDGVVGVIHHAIHDEAAVPEPGDERTGGAAQVLGVKCSTLAIRPRIRSQTFD
jgi:hypothetical protein